MGGGLRQSGAKPRGAALFVCPCQRGARRQGHRSDSSFVVGGGLRVRGARVAEAGPGSRALRIEASPSMLPRNRREVMRVEATGCTDRDSITVSLSVA